MGVLRTAVAMGALLISVPVMAQPGRSGADRSRTDRGGDTRGGRQDPRAERRTARRDGGRVAGGGTSMDRGRAERPRGGEFGRVEPRTGGGRVEPRRWEPRGGDPRGGDPRGGTPDWTRGRVDRRDEPRVAVRPPVIVNRYDRRTPRVAPPVRYNSPMRYRYGDRDYRHRDYVTISTWFRALPLTRLTAYGYYGPNYGGIRYVFRPGLYVSLAVYGQLGLLPYELELELGELPWYLERRIYGNTVLVIDTRTRLVVDIFEVDY